MGFQDILGHRRQRDTLCRAIQRDRVHHAYLFVGPPGVGRRTLALTFGRALNCGRHDGDACEECISCRKIMNGTHPDVLIIGEGDSELTIKVEEVREKILRFVSFKVFEGRYRVIIVLDVERMNNSTANALLKTLEEPPAQTVFVLTTAHANALLPTIRSRCQKVQLSPVPEPLLCECLETQFGIPAERATLLARLADGSLGKALSLTEERLAVRSEFLSSLIQVGRDESLNPLELADKLSGNKDTKRVLLSQLESLETFLRDTAVLQTAPGARLRNPDQADALTEFSSRVTFRDIHGLVRLIWELRGAVRLNIKPKVVLERLFLEFDQVQRIQHATQGSRRR